MNMDWINKATGIMLGIIIQHFVEIIKNLIYSNKAINY